MTGRSTISEQREGEGEPALLSSPTQRARSFRPADKPDDERGLHGAIAHLEDRPLEALYLHWRNHLGGSPPRHLPRWLFIKLLAYRLQAQVHGDLSPATLRLIRRGDRKASTSPKPFQARSAVLREGRALRPGSILMREWQGRLEQVMMLDEGFAWQGGTYASLSAVAKAITGTSWNGHRFFGLASTAHAPAKRTRHSLAPSTPEARR